MQHLHGVGDECNKSTVVTLIQILSQSLNVHAECIGSVDGLASWFTPMKTQLATACANLKSNPNFAGKDIDIVGLSQGNLIARGIIQSCDFGGSVKRFLHNSSARRPSERFGVFLAMVAFGSDHFDSGLLIRVFLTSPIN